MDIGATWYNNGKGNKRKRKGKGKHNKGKGYGGYGNNYSYSNYKGGKGNTTNNRLDKEILAKEKDTATKEKAQDTRTTRIWQRKRIQQQRKSQRTPGQEGYGKGKENSNRGLGKGYKDNKDMAKAKDTATKEKARDTTTINQEEKEQKESKQQMIATDADNQDTWPNNVERRSTTATLATSTPMTKQMTGTVRHTMAATGTTRINTDATTSAAHNQQIHQQYPSQGHKK